MNDWTNEEEQFLKNNYLQYSNEELATLLNKTEGAIRGRKTKLGLRAKHYYSEAENNFIINNYLNLSDSEMAKALNLSECSVTYQRKRLGCKRSKKKYSFQDVVQGFTNKNLILLSTENEYQHCLTPLRYICSIHKDKGVLTTCFGHILEGKGCPYCGKISASQQRQISTNRIKTLCESKGLVYKNHYMGKNHSNNRKHYVTFVCSKHPLAGEQTMDVHNLYRDFIIGCKYCGADYKKMIVSKGEKHIRTFLRTMNINFVSEYEFEDCRDICALPFDFYLPQYKIAIEFDGEHHYYPVGFNGISREKAHEIYKKTVRHDLMKTEYCKKHNITLLRIPYWKRDKESIYYILLSFFIDQKVLEEIKQ